MNSPLPATQVPWQRLGVDGAQILQGTVLIPPGADLEVRLPRQLLGVEDSGARGRFGGFVLEVFHRDRQGFGDPIDVDYDIGGRRSGTALLRPLAGIVLEAGDFEEDSLVCRLRFQSKRGRQADPAGRACGVRLFGFCPSVFWGSVAERHTWILSSARSGTTWLTQMLCEFQGVRPMDETGVGRMLGAHKWEPERSFPWPDLFSKGYDTPPAFDRDGIVPGPQGRRPFARQLLAWTDRQQFITNDRSLDVLREAMVGMVLRQAIRVWGVSGLRAVVVKCPNDAHGVELLARWMPTSRLILLVRDGRDTIRSRFTPFASKILATTKDPELRKYAVAWFSHLWNFHIDASRHAVEGHDPERACTIRYEDLRKDPLQAFLTAARVAGFDPGEDEAQQILDARDISKVKSDQKGADKPVQSGKVGGYAEAFSRDEMRIMARVMRSNLKRYGYEC